MLNFRLNLNTISSELSHRMLHKSGLGIISLKVENELSNYGHKRAKVELPKAI